MPFRAPGGTGPEESASRRIDAGGPLVARRMKLLGCEGSRRDAAGSQPGDGLLRLPRLGRSAQTRQLELGVESFAYRSATTPLNRDNVLGLDSLPRPRPSRPRLEGDPRLLPGRLPRLRRAHVGHAGRRDRLGGPAGLRPVLVGREGGPARSASSASPGARASPGTPPTASSPRRTRSTPRSSRKGPSPRGSTGRPRPGRASFSSAPRRTPLPATCRWPRATSSAATPSPCAPASW